MKLLITSKIKQRSYYMYAFTRVIHGKHKIINIIIIFNNQT
jgi:hypothetical protein